MGNYFNYFNELRWNIIRANNLLQFFLKPQNRLDKLWFTFSEEIIIRFQYFFSNIYQIIQIQFQR